jgi:hypothetical protein
MTMTMRKLQIFATAAALLAVASAPTLAASRSHRAVDAYASGAVTTDRSGAYYYGPQDAQGRAFVAPSQADSYRYNRGAQGGEPYVDRPYGAPDNW